MKQVLKTAFAIFFFIPFLSFARLSVEGLKCESKTNPIAIEMREPVFSWRILSDARGTLQESYQMRVSTAPFNDTNIKNLVWDSGRKKSGQSMFVHYGGTPLKAAKKYFWQTRVWDNKGNVSEWSAQAFFGTGLQAADWQARWINAGFMEDTVTRPSPIFRKHFTIGKKIQSAIAYISARGLYEAAINGKRVGDGFLTPGWTSYKNRIPYQAYDVAELLNKNNNSIGVELGSGWYRGYLAFEGQKNLYGKELALIFQLMISYTDGTSETIVSDSSWKSSVGGVVSSEIYNGEAYDARLEKSGWKEANYDDAGWSGVQASDMPKDNLVATENEMIKKHETFAPLHIITTPKGEKVIDFGQNLVGWVQIKVKERSGDKILISHAEVLDKSGNFYVDNLRAAKEQNTYTLKGGMEETFEPHFTFQGFRYIKVEGFPGELKPENFMAVALYSDMKPTGVFSCSNPLLNQLQHNIQWGQKGNFLDVPTDCPQRDERLGWTGDAQAFSRTATFNTDSYNFYSKWLKDLALDQQPDGRVPFVVPNALRPTSGGSAGWADAATIIPWNVYLAYGDTGILRRQYPSMKAWIGFMQQNSTNYLWNKGFHFGDWLFYSPADDNGGRAAVTDKYMIAQAFYAYSTQLTLNAARILGKKEDTEQLVDLLQHIKDAFLKEYVTPNGRMASNTQTAYVLALQFDLLPESIRMQAAQRLVDNIREYKDHITTGFLGTPYICHVLSRFGFTDVAYTLLLQDTYPSWLYPVKMGATTIWERWDGQKPDSTFQVPSMNSFNHYAYGAIGDWMYRVMAGIDTEEDGPGYQKIKIMPHPGGKLTYANVDLMTNYGPLSAHWKTDSGKFTLYVEIPANTTAHIYLPAADGDQVFESDRPVSDSKEIKYIGKEGAYAQYAVGSGKYSFIVAAIK